MKRALLSFLFSLIVTLYTYNGVVPITINWDPSPTPGVIYQVQLVKGNGQILTYQTNDIKITIIPPSTGNYHARVRATLPGDGGSAWCGSLMANCAELKNGTKGEWEMQFKPIPPPKPNPPPKPVR